MKAAKSPNRRRKGGGVKGAEAFASKFASGNPRRLLAFRLQTSLRSAAGDPPTAEGLAAKFKLTRARVRAALELLVAEGRARTRTKDGQTVYVSP